MMPLVQANRHVGPARRRPSEQGLSSPSSLRRFVAPSLSYSAFTLIELLVVIGIIALLAGMILFGVGRGRTAATKARIASDLQVIATALEAYKQDFRDYPRLDQSPLPDGTAAHVYGSQLLCWTLIAPGNQATDGAGAHDPTDAANPTSENLPGFGFRTRKVWDPANSRWLYQGQPYGPYLKPDAFKIAPRGNYSAPAAGDNTDEILDYAGHPILYYPANPTRAAIVDPTVAYVNNLGGVLFNNVVLPPSLFDSRENDPAVLSLPHMRAILGDTNQNGRIDPNAPDNEKAAYTGPYILWSAGVDGLFGKNAAGKTDDITNFER